MVSRVTNLSSQKLIGSLILKSQDRINEAQVKLATQQKSQDYLGIAEDAKRLVTVESSVRRIEQFEQDNKFVKMRMQSMMHSMDGLSDIISDVKALLREILDDGNLPPGMDKDEIAELKMDEISMFLNTKINGRFLFAGTKTDTKPIEEGNLASAPTFNADGVTTTAEPTFYYKGDDGQVKARIDEGVELEYGINANESGFEKLIRSLRIIKSTSLTDANANGKFLHTLDLINQASDEITAVELKTGIRFKQLDNVNNYLENTKAVLQGVVTDIERADTFETVAELNQVQTQLEASYTTAVRVSNLSLANFLRR